MKSVGVGSVEREPLVAVVGLGAIGTRLTVELARASGCELLACARRTAPSLVLEGSDEPLACSPRIETSPARATHVDWVLLCTKSHQIEGAADWLRALRRGDTLVAVLQNGVEHRERLAGLVPAELVVPVVVEAPTERIGSERVRARGPARLFVGRGERRARFAALFVGSNVSVNEVDGFDALAWAKLVHNCAGAARALEARSELAAALGRRELATRLAAETVDVAAELGVRLPSGTLDSAVTAALALGEDRRTSLEADLLAGRPTEVDARNGAVARFGRERHLDERWNELALQFLR